MADDTKSVLTLIGESLNRFFTLSEVASCSNAGQPPPPSTQSPLPITREYQRSENVGQETFDIWKYSSTDRDTTHILVGEIPSTNSNIAFITSLNRSGEKGRPDTVYALIAAFARDAEARGMNAVQLAAPVRPGMSANGPEEIAAIKVYRNAGFDMSSPETPVNISHIVDSASAAQDARRSEVGA